MHMRLVQSVGWMTLVVILAAPLPAVVGGNSTYNQDLQLDSDHASDEELERAYWNRRRIKAAQHRLDRIAALPSLDESYHQAGAIILQQAQAELAAMDLKAARNTLEAGLDDYGYSHSAAGMTHALLRSYLIAGELRYARMHLIDLWERYPDYQQIATVMDETLLAAEYLQQTGHAFNLEAVTPQEVIDYDAGGEIDAADHVFHFLMIHGDRRKAAPRSVLGIARGMLLRAGTSEDRLIGVRMAYDRFLDNYPDHPQVFDALVEQAVSYLLNYRGAKFDTGVLLSSSDLIEQAALYINGDRRRQDIVTRFRALIRRWRQDRDLEIARWYRDCGDYGPANYYYTEVLGRDATSASADVARRERAELPQADTTGLGAPVTNE